MYEENRVQFDWKGFFIKFAIIVLVVVLIIILLPFKKNTTTENSTTFNSNLTKLKSGANDYFNLGNLPTSDGDKVKVTLEELEDSGSVESLYDEDGNECSGSDSYVTATKNDNDEYELELYLVCGSESDTSSVYLNYDGSTDTTTTSTTTTTTTTKKASSSTSSGTSSSSSSSSTSSSKTTAKTTTTTTTTTKKYTVVFNSNGGTSVASQYIKSGSAATTPTAPTRSGYTFNGWYLNSSKYSFGSSVTSNIILTASWTKNSTSTTTTYTVSFDSNGGTSVGSQYIKSGSTASTPVSPTRSGYTFNGWYLNGSRYYFTNAVTSNITLTASWSKNSTSTTYTVSFNSNGGTSVSYQTVTRGSVAYNPGTPTRSGYTFDGWYYNDEEYSFSTRVYSNITLTAKWSKSKTYSETVYSAGYGVNTTTTFTVNHKLLVPEALDEDNITNVHLTSVSYVRSLSSSTDINKYYTLHSVTFDGYTASAADYNNAIVSNLAYVYYAYVYETNSNYYNRNVTWTGYVSNQCSTTFWGSNCIYGIVYTATWTYDIEY